MGFKPHTKTGLKALTLGDSFGKRELTKREKRSKTDGKGSIKRE